MGFWLAPLLTSLQTHLYNLGTKVKVQRKEEEMENLWLVLFWSGPIGVGIFLVCLGTMIWLLSKADAIKKSVKAKEKE